MWEITEHKNGKFSRKQHVVLCHFSLITPAPNTNRVPYLILSFIGPIKRDTDKRN